MSKSKEKKESITETIKTVIYALLIAGIFRSFFFQPFWIPSGSMKDTLLVGDFLFVNKMIYGYSKYSCPFNICPIPDRLLSRAPSRGDVVVFRHPTNDQDYIKRLIGLPGDTVQIKNGVIYLNGIKQVQKRDGYFDEIYTRQGSMGGFPACYNKVSEIGETCKKEKFLETLDGLSNYTVLNIRKGLSGDDTPKFSVPLGHFFFMGDNRDNSVDSRFLQERGGVGFVPFANLLGRADLILFSSSGKRMFYFWTWRKERFFKSVN